MSAASNRLLGDGCEKYSLLHIETGESRMKEICSLVQGVLTLETFTVGPKHDPYGRMVIKMTNRDNNPKWELVLCGLAGIQLTVFDKGVYSALVFPENSVSDELMETFTGMPIHFWEYKVWQYKDRALYAKLGRKRYEQYHLCMEADMSLLRYAM